MPAPKAWHCIQKMAAWQGTAAPCCFENRFKKSLKGPKKTCKKDFEKSSKSLQNSLTNEKTCVKIYYADSENDSKKA